MHVSNIHGRTIAARTAHRVPASAERGRGVALVAVLAVLTVLGIMAAAFAVFMNLESKASDTRAARTQADILADSAFEHAMSMLRQDVREQPAWDSLREPWRKNFLPRRDNPTDNVDVDGLPGAKEGASPADARWIYVKNALGQVAGRYAVMIEDESGKININTAVALSPKMQNQGVGAFEIMLTDGKTRGLPISIPFGKNILRYRYGRDYRPGQAGRDDNLTAASYAHDEIDNDADGIFDEPGEGVDEPEEYTPRRPVWDDRVFPSVDEAARQCSGKRQMSLNARNLLNKYCTVHSRTRDIYWDDRDGKWKKQVNLNVADRNQLRKVMRRGNEESPFEPSSSSLRMLVANMTDYRDENHVLTTIGNEYGVESVCFNEIMAYDFSWIRETDWCGWWARVAENSPDSKLVPLCYNYFYGQDMTEGYYNGNKMYRWRIDGKKSKPIDTTGTERRYEIALKEPKRQTSIPRFRTFHDYCDTRWPKDMWLGATLMVAEGYNTKKLTNYYKVVESPETIDRKVVVSCTPESYEFLKERVAACVSNTDASTVCLYSDWVHAGAMWCDTPGQTETYFFHPPTDDPSVKDYYYRVYVANHCFIPSYGYGRSLVREMDMDGIPAAKSVTHESKLKYVYKEGKAVRANKAGYIRVCITSSDRCTPSPQGIGGKHLNFNDCTYFVRPDIVEMINISQRAISLRNWQVVVNTGLDAWTLARVESALHHSKSGGAAYDDPNPCVKPNGYFYLTNNREIFAREYCGGNPNYGRGRSQSIPVFELPEEDWGILYRIKSVSHDMIKVGGANWKRDQLKYELIEYVSDRSPADKDPPNGQFKMVWGNTRNTLDIRGSDATGSGLRSGDKIRVRGLPRQGGFVSFTMKNEYNQVTARTTEYGSIKEREYGFSTEKVDPTHYPGVKCRHPTIGGDERKARNRSLRRGEHALPHVKNNRFSSVGEIQHVRRAEDWSSVGQAGGKASTRVLKAITKYLTTSGIRLDAEEEGAHIRGWKPAFGRAVSGSKGTVRTQGADWEPGIWAGRRMRVVSGNLKGEEFVVKDNTQNNLMIDGYSTEGGKTLSMRKGDVFSVGAGYTTPMYYTRKSGDKAEWEWQHKDLEPMSYGLYLLGLNDSIRTTEFLEENWNAKFDVDVFNFKTREYDRLPLDGGGAKALDDAYTVRGSAERLQYGKSDLVFCGTIQPAHVSPDGGIRLLLTAHNLDHERCSGFAWFDCAYLAPAGALGKININTASERVLTGLKGVSPAIARNIARGIDHAGKAHLRPYKNISDALDVRGVTPALFGDIANLITTRSDQYRIRLVAEALKDVDGDGCFDESAGDQVLAQSRRDIVVDRGELTDDDPESSTFRILARTGG